MDERAFDDLLELYRWRFAVEDPRLVDWTRTMRVRPRITDDPVRDQRPDAPSRNTTVFGPGGDVLAHPDASIEIVVLDEAPSAARTSEARRVARDAVFVWTGPDTVAAHWQREPVRRGVEVSVAVHGPAEGRAECLAAIAGTVPDVEAIEVFAAEPADDTAVGMNAALDRARGAVVVLVDAGTTVRTGWLRPLVRTLREEPEVGVAGGRLVAGDETLVDAGGIVFADGSRVGYGCGHPDPGAAQFIHARDVHALSPALLATRTGLARQLGGFDATLPAETAAIDYCLRAGAAGRRVVYQPQSLATSAAPAVETLDAAAARRFQRRWAARLAGFPERPERLDDGAWDRLVRVP